MEVVEPLADDGAPTIKLRAVAKALERFSAGGTRPCLLESLSLGEARPDLDALIQSSTEALFEGFAKLARDGGAARVEARRRSQETFIRLQGRLILARTSDDAQPFKRFLPELPALPLV